MHESIKQRFQKVLPAVEFCSLRYQHESSETLRVRQNVLQPPTTSTDAGVMLTVLHQGGMGYAATSDLSESGLREALQRAQRWAEASRQRNLIDTAKLPRPQARGEYSSRVLKAWHSQGLDAKLDLLHQEAADCKLEARVSDWVASLWYVRSEQLYLNSEGAEILQQFDFLTPYLSVTAFEGQDSQTRTFGAHAYSRQGGLEILEQVGFVGRGRELAEQALQLLAAPNCPSGPTELVLMPDQMMLQIHESIGHPLELDRILGDERNYAGTSFVDLDMFGSHQYGSPLLNVSFDPTLGEQFASYAYDDEASPAQKEYLIRDGILQRPLGGAMSQSRCGLPGTANARACSWNRPPIDRMANLNIEPGNSSLTEIIGSIERGVLMQTNRSWSIDDSRNKFQFGCEWGRLIEHGELTGVVKNPNYRGISANFWRNLSQVGDSRTFEVLGVPFCGKGEPNQVIRVGHASPVCRFSNVDVFGGV